ncbi:hypothetical protein H5410_061559 [Solanum commersonii]|uniref:Uncharacterized protein n=1 Tax=Solanum commersonii TaxID=4109 RepID=A0A9J5W8D3_SOLCO|nr:hypothetical protein H5410_061559 [Solanum commersonii]
MKQRWKWRLPNKLFPREKVLSILDLLSKVVDTSIMSLISWNNIDEMEAFLRSLFYGVVVSLSLLYRVECLPVKNSQVQNMHVAKVRILTCMCSTTSSDKIEDKVIGEKVRVADVADKMREARLK